jgi:UDP-N-acetylmuramoyl-tripeptide--D-alanyl-D-alanine ligase
MPELRIVDLVEATGGSLVRGEPEGKIRSYAIDTRRLERGGAFFALKGENSDGHDFLADAAPNAAAAVIARELENGQGAPPAVIRVDDVQQALARAARWVRGKLSRVKWVAITGSNGKTTTKEMLAEGLAGRLRVHRSPGNFNNHLGLPLSMLACPQDTEVGVIEMAMSGPGEIAELTRIVEPHVGILTNVRAAHLAAFRTMEDIAAAKGELFALLRDDAIAVVNLDDSQVRVQASRHAGPRVTFGQNAAADVRLEELQNRFLPGAAFVLRCQDKRRRVQLRIGGAHAAMNAVAALAGIVAVEGDLDAAIDRIEQLEAGPGRGKIHRLSRGMLLVDDSYNSSPGALASVLETVRLSEPDGRKVLVLGDMLELGPMQDALHREAGKRVATAGAALFIGVGPLSRATTEAARRAGVPEVHHHLDSSKAADSVAEFLRDGDLIVVKGSRAMRMERVVEALLEQSGKGN